MKYHIKRLDGENDEITTQSLAKYNEGYDLLSSIYENICCSDAEYDDRRYYEILKIRNVTKR